MSERGDGLDPRVVGVGVATGNPFRPGEIQIPPGMQNLPPTCPDAVCRKTGEAAVYLYPVSTNEKGDILFACGLSGYEAVYRRATNTYEPRPGREYSEGFTPPRLVSRTGQIAGEPGGESARPAPAASPRGKSKRVFLSPEEVIERSGLPASTIRPALRSGKLRAMKRSGRYRIALDDLDAFLADRATPKTARRA